MKKYVSSDLYVSAALKASGQPLLRVARQGNSTRVAWVFADEDDRTSFLVGRYWDGTLSVGAKAFVTALFELRRQIDSVRNSVSTDTQKGFCSNDDSDTTTLSA